MLKSTDRILVTHAGALPREESLTTLIRAKAARQPVDEARLEAALRSGVADAVRKQLENGVDSVSDGELSKANFMHYITGRVSGISLREYEPGKGPVPLSIIARDRTKFPDYFTGERGGFASGGKEVVKPMVRQFYCAEPLKFVGQEAVRRDVANLKAALEGKQPAEAFLASVTPGVIEHWLKNEHYKDDEAYLFAIADVMREEYLAIIEGGFTLQVDNPDVADGWQMFPDMTVPQYRDYAELRIAALNHALRGIPREKVRVHVCWGSFHGPHEFDLPLKEFVDILFKVNAAAVSIEAANPRHEHEWNVFERFKVPKDTVLIPGVAGHCTNFIEHPELIAQRLVRYAKLVGRENVVAGTDCGLGNRTATPGICWAKFNAMAEGAKLATKVLWGG
jgi:5-methyltetrahydropteroyltriglutamate--homocysteine methyltransferase